MPASSRRESGTRPGMCPAAVDPDATAAAPGVASNEEEAAGRASAEASKHAGALGKVFADRFGECAAGPNDAQALVENAKGCADRCALGAGFRRCASRVSVPNTRASWSLRDAPEFMASPEWCLFGAFCLLKPPRSHRVQSYRFAERPPMSESLRSSLFSEGFAYQFASRASALAFLLASVWLAPTVSYSDRVMVTVVITRAIAARERARRKMVE